MGVSFDDVAPWLNVAGRGAGALAGGFAKGALGTGSGSGASKDDVKKALEDQKAKEELEKAKAKAKTETTILIVGGSVIGVSLLSLVLWKLLKR